MSKPSLKEPGITARYFNLSIVFIAFDDSVTLNSDLGVQLGRLVIAPPYLKYLILLSERGQDIAKLADLLADQPRHRFFTMFAPPLLVSVQGVGLGTGRRRTPRPLRCS